jgi:hypothetical protein
MKAIDRYQDYVDARATHSIPILSKRFEVTGFTPEKYTKIWCAQDVIVDL